MKLLKWLHGHYKTLKERYCHSKIKSYKILDIAKAIDPKRKIKIIGLRPGEKFMRINFRG